MSDSLERIRTLAELMVKKEDEVKRLTDTLKELKADLTRLSMEDLPDLMTELGLTEIKLLDGSTVAIRQEVACSIAESRREIALAWLTEHNFGGLIKTSISLSFSPDEKATAEELAAEMRQRFESIDFKESVHPATLKSFVKEQLQSGSDIPFELFGIHPYNVATINTPKRGK